MKRILSILVLLCFLIPLCAGCVKEGPADASLSARGEGSLAGTLESYDAIAAWFPGKELALYDGEVISEPIASLIARSGQKWLANYADMAAALRAGQIDGFFCEAPLAPFLCASMEGLYTPGILMNEENYACVFARDNAALCEQLNATIARLRADGTLAQMQEKWGSTDENLHVMPDIVLTGENGTLQVATSNEEPPFGYIKDGEHVGYDYELLSRFAEEYGYALEYGMVDWAATTAAVISGKYDIGVGCMVVTEEREEVVLFSEPIYYSGAVLIVSDEYAPETDGPAAGSRIGAMTGTTCEALAIRRYPKANYASFTGTGDMMAALKSGKLDYCVASEIDGVNYRRSDPGYNILPGTLESGTYNIAVAKGNEALLAKLNALLDQYEADGTLSRLKENWIRPDGSAYVIDEVPAAEGPELRVAFCSGLEPSCFIRDGEVVGYDIELIRRLSYDMGCRVAFLDMDFSALVAALESGRADVAISGISATPERAEKVDFTRAYYEDPIVLVTYDRAAAPDRGFFAGLTESFYKNFIVESRWKLIVSGIGVTLLLSVCSGILGILIGFGFCLMRMSRQSGLCGAVTAVTRILQGTPMVVLLMIFYYIVFNKTGLDGISVSVIAFGLNFGAYASEILLSGINAVDAGQREAASAIGFTGAQTFRKIVFPQAARHFLPVLKGEYISLVKTTSIVGYVAVQDLTKVSDIIRSRTYEAFFPLIITALIYFLLSVGLSSLLRLIEVRIDPKRRPRTLKGVEL